VAFQAMAFSRWKKMVVKHPAYSPNGRPLSRRLFQLGFVDLSRDTGCLPGARNPLIPEVIPILVYLPFPVIRQPSFRREPWLEFDSPSARGCMKASTSRNAGSAGSPARGQGRCDRRLRDVIGSLAVRDIPLAIQRHRESLGTAIDDPKQAKSSELEQFRFGSIFSCRGK